MDKLQLRFGITKTATGYNTEPIREGKQYDIYIANSNLTTAGCQYNIVDKNLEDLIEAKGWRYYANYVWGCFAFLGYSINITLTKWPERISFKIEESDDIHSEFVRIMMLIADTCETLDDAKQLLIKNHIIFRDIEEHKIVYQEEESIQATPSSPMFTDSSDETKSDDVLPF